MHLFIIWCDLSGLSWVGIKLWAPLDSYLEAPGKNRLPGSFRLLAEFSFSGCKAEVPAPSLVVSQRWCLAPGATLQPCAGRQQPSQGAQASCWHLGLSPLPPAPGSTTESAPVMRLGSRIMSLCHQWSPWQLQNPFHWERWRNNSSSTGAEVMGPFWKLV